MSLLKFSISLSITVILLILLNNRIGSVPPVGKFLDPFNGFYRNAETSDSHFEDESLIIPGLQDTVLVQYDEHMVPHIQATNNYDLYYTQGFLTAKFRLWQMEVQTHFAAGRLTEIFGESMLETDRLTRRKGIPYGADRALAAMESDSLTKIALEAYSEGVNAYIKKLKYRNIPFEYKLLNYKPEEWTPGKTALLLKYMANDLAGRDYDLENTNVVNLFGKETFDYLFPERLPDTDPVIPTGTPWKFKPKLPAAPEQPFQEIFTQKTTPKPLPDNGSNNWAVNGSKTKSGNPILANDPHLQLNLPSLWFVVQLSGPDVNTYGATLPGAPGIIIGFNDSISWGVTNATRDVKDWYAIQYKNKDKSEYAYEGKWLKTEKKVESFRLRSSEFWSRDKMVNDTVLFTHHGPVVYDQSFPGKPTQQDYALRWTAHDASNELKAFLLLNRATNYEEFSKAISHYQTPAQNFVFASVNNTIAMWVQGKFPVKWKEQGKFLMDGSQQEYEWKGFIPQEFNAHVVNPPRGFVSSANQMPVDNTYPYYTYDQNYQHYRNRRINQVLAKAKNLTIQEVMLLQTDNYNLKASETLPWMLDSLKVVRFDSLELVAYKKLKSWNFEQLAKLSAPALYQSWWDNFRGLLWDEFDSLQVEVVKPSDGRTVDLLRKEPRNRFVDIQLTPEQETIGDLLRASFSQTIVELRQWQEEKEQEYNWGNYKNSSIRHLTQQEALSETGLQVDGGRDIVNANSGRHGVSWRMIVEMGQPVKAFGIYPGGQSGNPGSPYYNNFIETWRNGQYNRLYFISGDQRYQDKILFNQTLKPEE